MIASFLANNNMLPRLEKQHDYTELKKEAKGENDFEKEAEQDGENKDWITPIYSSQTKPLIRSIDKDFAHYYTTLLVVESEIEVQPPKC